MLTYYIQSCTHLETLGLSLPNYEIIAKRTLQRDLLLMLERHANRAIRGTPQSRKKMLKISETTHLNTLIPIQIY